MNTKQRCIPIIFIILCLWLAGCIAPQQSSSWSASNTTDSQTWPMEGANPQRNRLVDANIEPPLNQLLELPLILSDGQPMKIDTAHTSPLSIGEGLLVAESIEKLHVYDLATGQQRWDFNLPGSFLSPTIADGHIFVRAESGDDGFLYALTADRGSKLWQYKFPAVGSSSSNMGGHVTSPLVIGDKVLAGASRTLRAFALESGTELWTFDTENPIASSPSAGDDGLIYVTDFESVYAIDSENGEQLWRFQHDTLTLFFAPIVIEDQLFITSGSIAIVLDRVSGEELWRQIFEDGSLIPAAASLDYLYAKSPNILYALDRDTGEKVWQYSAMNFVSIPAVTPNQIYIITRADGGSQLRALNPESGEEVWQVRNNRLSNAAPIAADGRIFARSIDGAIFAYQGTDTK